MALVLRPGTLKIWDGTALQNLTVRQYNGLNLSTTFTPHILVDEQSSLWKRGVAGTGVTDGRFASWAGYVPELAGTWNDSSPAVQIDQWSINASAGLGAWPGAIDNAIGAIWKPQGESWAAAANGSYDTRWRQALTNMAKNRSTTTAPTTTTGTALTGTVKIMPVGDSLTAVDDFALGYKGILLDLLIAAGKSIDYVGSKTANGPAALKDKNHNARSGATNATWLGGDYLNEVALNTRVTQYTPHVMTYMNGVNDLWSNHGVSTAVTRLNTVLDQAYAAAPNMRVVVCTIPLMGVAQNSQRADYNNGVRAAVTRLKAAGRHCTLAELSNTLVSSDLQGDGIHWTSGGHTKVANALRPTLLEVINGGTITVPTSPTPTKGQVYIRFAHEFSLSQMPWSVTASEATNFKAAWVRFRNLQREIFPAAKLVWCPNAGQNTGLDIRNAWPGEQHVDVYGVDHYNNYPAANTVAECVTQFNRTESFGAPIGIQRHWEAAQGYGKPFALCEWATDGDPNAGAGGKDAPVWIQYLFDWLMSHNGIEYECLFNVTDFGSGQYGFYPTTKSPQAAARYRDLWGSRGAATPKPPGQSSGVTSGGWSFTGTAQGSAPQQAIIASDTFTGANGAAWSAIWTTAGHTATGTGRVIDIQSNTGRLRTGTTAGAYNGANKAAIRLVTAPPTDFTCTFRFMNEATETYPRVLWRASAEFDGVADYETHLDRSSEVAIYKSANYSGGTIGTVGTFDHSVAGTWYWCRIKVQGSSHKVKVWGGTLAGEPLTGGADGAGFQAVATDVAYTSGNFAIHNSAGGTGPANFYIDDFTMSTI